MRLEAALHPTPDDLSEVPGHTQEPSSGPHRASLSATLPMRIPLAVRGVPAAARAVIVGLERRAVVMIEGNAPVTAPSPVLRLAYVGAFELRDRHGHILRARRFASAAGESADAVIERLMIEVADACYERDDLTIAIVQDGVDDNAWALLRTAIAETGDGDCVEAVDRGMLHRRISRVLEVIEADPMVRAAELTRWAWRFDLADHTIDELIVEIDSEIARATPAAAASLGGHRAYFAAQRARMRYVKLRAAGVVLHAPCTGLDDRSPPRRVRRAS